LNLNKIEQCATGAVYCGVLDALYPGTFAISKVKWGAKHEYEYVENYKILQSAFDKNGIKRHIDVAKLTKARYLDNLEFCQWLKAFFEKNYNGEPYDALNRRKGQDLHYILGGTKVAPPTSKGAAQPKPSAPARAAPRAAPSGGSAASGIGGGAPRSFGGGSSANAAEVKKLQDQIQELKLQTDTLDKERDFYFSKLRDIELLLQARTQGADSPGYELG
jgi:RP/EB family microtubule-associated protein